MRSLDAYLNRRKVGTLHEGDDLWRFEYDAGWMQAIDGFDLSPGLPRAQQRHLDGASRRTVQWYFDNLLPEETLREAVSKEAGIAGDDAFALLAYLGAESAGSLVLVPTDHPPPGQGGVVPLPEVALCRRIRNLPRTTLGSEAPKRMSAAGAQHKLLVVYRDGALFEPVGAEPSTHILKPNHPSGDYPASVINEYFCMRLVQAVLGDGPGVHRRYTPEPVYLVERFDRYADAEGSTQRRHIVDACQLLDKSRSFKYQAASVATLAEIVGRCRNRAVTRLRLFSWLVFNLLIANDDNHLKNLSFLVTHEGIALAPWYDLLSTGSYRTRAFADERATWPAVDMMVPLPGATRFGDVTRSAVLQAGAMLGVPRRLAERELDRIATDMRGAVPSLVDAIAAENAGYPPAVHPYLTGEMRLLRTIQHLVVPEMLRRVVDG